jgi:putative pyrroloquinoline-quinone binding quinoprotein
MREARILMQGSLKSSASRRNLPISRAVFVFLFLIVFPVFARETKTIQKSSSASGDQQLRAADATLNLANPATKYGSLPTLTISSLTGNTQRAVVQMDLSSLPNVAIKQAILKLHVTTAANRNGTYQARRVTSFFNESDVTWNTRVATTAWGAKGGDFSGTTTASFNITNATTVAQWDITADVQNWYNGTPNYGTLIKDATEGRNAANQVTTSFASKETALAGMAPELDVTFVQNVTNITAAPGNNSVTVSWAYPSPIGTVNPGEPYVGVLILRRANFPVDKASVPTDTTDPAMCSTVGSGIVVFDNSTNATSFTDDNTDPCGAPANGTTWFYKVFLRDNLNYYASQPIANGSVFTEELSAMPNSPATNQQNSSWIAATFSTTLAAPALFPGSVIMVGSQTNLLFAVDANTGLRMYPPVSLGGPVNGRAPIIDSADSSLGVNVVYVADNDGLVYAVATDTGQILWVVNPNGATTNAFQGAGSVQLKSLSGGSYTLAHDLLVVGTRNGATTTGNQILGLDANTGATLWTLTGGILFTAAMDIISSAPAIDYVNNAVWVTSRSAGGTTQPSLWKLSPNTGAVLLQKNLGDTDADPSLSFLSDVLFVGNNAGTLYAINPVTGATLASFAGGDGAIVSYPVVLGSFSPYTVIFSGKTAVHAVTFNLATNTFTTAWPAPVTINVPSAPLAITGFTNVYVGSNDGKIHEINLATGVDGFDWNVNTGQPGFVGDPGIDLTLSRIYVSTTDQRAYAFPIPF